MKQESKGLLFCLLLAVPCYYLGTLFPVIGGPVFGILLGIIVGTFLPIPSILHQGITFTSKKILQYAVILLGFGLNMRTVIEIGTTSLPIILGTITTALLLSYFLAKVLNIPRNIATLIGVGSSICGGSAIAATAPVINAKDHDIAQAISVIFLYNILAALIFPTLGGLIGFSNEGFALFAGTAVNDTSSVTAAASSWDAIHKTGTMVLDEATIVKLTRTLAIIPITMVLAIYEAKQNTRGKKVSIKKIFPTFIIYFLVASLLTTFVDQFEDNSFTLFLESLFAQLKTISKFFIVMAMTAIGLNTDVVKLIRSGIKPMVQGLCLWISISFVSILLQKLMGVF
ncbi:MAG: YeiH family protein [Tissierellia bacterium]|nr:YeiH family protein [Tissierellia bacterium]